MDLKWFYQNMLNTTITKANCNIPKHSELNYIILPPHIPGRLITTATTCIINSITLQLGSWLLPMWYCVLRSSFAPKMGKMFCIHVCPDILWRQRQDPIAFTINKSTKANNFDKDHSTAEVGMDSFSLKAVMNAWPPSMRHYQCT